MELSQLNEVPIFQSLDDATLKKIRDLLDRKGYSKNEIIIFEGEVGSSLYIINEGRVKITRLNDKGEEIILSILKPGDFFGEMAIFDPKERSANVEIMEDTELFILKRQDIVELINDNPKISVSLLKGMAGRLRHSNQLLKEQSLSNAENRIAMNIIHLAEKLGKIKQGKVTINKFPYQKEIAQMVGTTRETVSRTLNKFEKEGLISKENRKLIIPDYMEFVGTFTSE